MLCRSPRARSVSIFSPAARWWVPALAFRSIRAPRCNLPARFRPFRFGQSDHEPGEHRHARPGRLARHRHEPVGRHGDRRFASSNTDGATVYTGSTVVGNGGSAAQLTATQILQNTLTIDAGSTVTIAPSGAGMLAVAASDGPIVSGEALAAGRSNGTRIPAIRSSRFKRQSVRVRSAARRASDWKTALRRSSVWRRPIPASTRACWKAAFWRRSLRHRSCPQPILRQSAKPVPICSPRTAATSLQVQRTRPPLCAGGKFRRQPCGGAGTIGAAAGRGRRNWPLRCANAEFWRIQLPRRGQSVAEFARIQSGSRNRRLRKRGGAASHISLTR